MRIDVREGTRKGATVQAALSTVALDYVTDSANRREFEHRLEKALQRMDRDQDSPHALMFLDLDQFHGQRSLEALTVHDRVLTLSVVDADGETITYDDICERAFTGGGCKMDSVFARLALDRAALEAMSQAELDGRVLAQWRSLDDSLRGLLGVWFGSGLLELHELHEQEVARPPAGAEVAPPALQAEIF